MVLQLLQSINAFNMFEVNHEWVLTAFPLLDEFLSFLEYILESFN